MDSESTDPGSNPGRPFCFSDTALVAQWIAHWTSNPEVAGSNPVQGVFGTVTQHKILDGVVGNISACHADARGSIPRRGVNILYDTLAEWLRRQPAKLVCSACAGSNPAGVVTV